MIPIGLALAASLFAQALPRPHIQSVEVTTKGFTPLPSPMQNHPPSRTLGLPFGSLTSAPPPQIRSPQVPRNDVTGDGKSDLVWRQGGTGRVYVMPMVGWTPQPGDVAWTEPDGDWLLVGSGDLDGDRRVDLVWWNRTSGLVYGMFMEGTTVRGGSILHGEPDTRWQIQTVGDFDGDGQADLLWRHMEGGSVYLMPMNGTQQRPGSVLWTEPDMAWQILGSGDFDGDGRADLLWRHDTSGMLYLMLMDGSTLRAGRVLYTEPDRTWMPSALLDFNGDGVTDLVWRNATSGAVYAMPIQGATVQPGSIIWSEPSQDWQIAGTGDFDGDGQDELVWWNRTTGMVYGMSLNGTSVHEGAVLWTEPDTRWQLPLGPLRLEILPKPFPENLKIRTDHPRLFLTDALATRMLSKKADITAFMNYVTGTSSWMPIKDASNLEAIKTRLKGLWNLDLAGDGKPDPVGYLNKSNMDMGALNYGLAHYLAQRTGATEATKTLCRAYLRALAEILLEQDFTVVLPSSLDEPPRHTLYALGVLYDWGWDTYDPELKARIRAKCLFLMDYLNTNGNWRHLTNPYFSGGHTRFANVGALTALLAIRQDVEADGATARASYFRHLAQVVNNFRLGYNPTQSWMGEGGGYGMGWAYGSSYTSLEPYLVWDNATLEGRWMTPWLQERWAFQLHGIRNTNTYKALQRGGYDPFPYSGDVWDTVYDSDFQGTFLLSAMAFQAVPQAAWLYQRMTTTPYDSPFDMLLKDPSVTPAAPTALARVFPRSGYALMRDTWDLDNATLLEFKSSEYYNVNHHHRDQNAFTIFFRGPLAIDSGGYACMGNYGSAHWYNYYVRSIAHNTLLVYDPREVFTIYGRPVSNDGGQRSTGVDVPTLAQMQPGGSNNLAGIQAFETCPEFTYALGDASRAYHPDKLTRFTRSILFLPGHAGAHPGVVIHDRVVSPRPELKQTVLLHSIRQPGVSGKKVTLSIDDGMTTHATGTPRTPIRGGLVQETLLPEDALLTTVGGPGFEFYVGDDGKGNPHNYIEDKVSSHKGLREAGEWRVEVSPGSPRGSNSFLQVLSVNEGDATAMTARVLPSTTRLDGTVLHSPDTTRQTCVLVQHTPGNLDETLSLAGALPFNRLILLGVAPGTRIAVVRSASTLSLRTDPLGAHAATDQGVLVAAW